MLITIIIIILLFTISCKNKEKTWYQCRGKQTQKLFKETLLQNGYKRTYDKQNCDIYLPCKNTMNEFNKLSKNKKEIIMMLPNNWIIGTKKYLWHILEQTYGRQFAKTIMPNTYIMPKDIELLKKNYKGTYILKQEKQRQQGLLLSNNINHILNNIDKYKVVQKYDNNTMLFKNKKINIRIYLLLVCENGQLKGYCFDDGIISYTKNNYVNNSTNNDDSIASFYSSKKLYDNGYPITNKTFFQHNHNKKYNWAKIMINIQQILIYIIHAVEKYMCANNGSKMCELFGADFIISKNGQPKILEINKGPGMTPYNQIDKQMRTKLQHDIINIIINNNNTCNGFTKLN